MFGFWLLLISITLYIFASLLEGFANALHGRSSFGLLYLLALLTAILLLPFKMASDMMGPKRRR